MIISKEWVATLFNTKNEEATKSENKLAKANALLSQIDLAVGTLCPIIISFLLQRFGYHAVLTVMVAQHLLGAMVRIFGFVTSLLFICFLISFMPYNR